MSDDADKGHNCRHCVHFSVQRESWEMPWITWYECAKHPQYESLTSFPFKHTKCADFNARTVPVRENPFT
jgi:hypothetical protein